MVKITVGIEGVACGMCEAHINEVVRNAVATGGKSAAKAGAREIPRGYKGD